MDEKEIRETLESMQRRDPMDPRLLEELKVVIRKRSERIALPSLEAREGLVRLLCETWLLGRSRNF
jgi:hypothetical protein